MYQHLGWWFPDIDKHFVRAVEQFPIAIYQQATIDEAYKYVKNFNCAIDVGGNIGLHSVRFVQKFKNVIAFEPVTNNFECLQKNCSTFNNIELIKSGLGSSKFTSDIAIPADANNCGLYSLSDFNEYEGATIKETIQVDRLDSFNLSPDLIKIDAQGYDLEVIKGGLETIKTYRPVIIVEVETSSLQEDINAVMQGIDYTLVSRVKKDNIWIPK